jgi:hypothetical protein
MKKGGAYASLHASLQDADADSRAGAEAPQLFVQV